MLNFKGSKMLNFGKVILRSGDDLEDLGARKTAKPMQKIVLLPMEHVWEADGTFCDVLFPKRVLRF